MPLARHVNFTCTCYETGIIKRSEFVIALHSNAVLHPNIFGGIKGERRNALARRVSARSRYVKHVRARGRLSGTMVACARILERKTNPWSREAWKYSAQPSGYRGIFNGYLHRRAIFIEILRHELPLNVKYSVQMIFPCPDDCRCLKIEQNLR